MPSSRDGPAPRPAPSIFVVTSDGRELRPVPPDLLARSRFTYVSWPETGLDCWTHGILLEVLHGIAGRGRYRDIVHTSRRGQPAARARLRLIRDAVVLPILCNQYVQRRMSGRFSQLHVHDRRTRCRATIARGGVPGAVRAGDRAPDVAFVHEQSGAQNTLVSSDPADVIGAAPEILWCHAVFVRTTRSTSQLSTCWS